MGDTTEYHRRIRSFVRREGRMTDGQREALERLWPRYGIDYGDEPLDLDSLFGRKARRIIEIGFGDGENLRQQCINHPDTDFLGIEVYRNGVGRLLRGAEEAGLDNLRVICDDAVEILQRRIPSQGIDELWVYFPDPWPKKRHHKRRLIQPPFCDLAAGVLKPDGIFRLATDWENYAEQMQEVLDAHPEFERMREESPDNRIVTRFQRRGERLGHGVWDFAYQRTPV